MIPIPLFCFLLVLAYIATFELEIGNLIVLIGIVYSAYLVYLSIVLIRDVMSFAIRISKENSKFMVETFSGEKYLLNRIKVASDSEIIIKQKKKNLGFLLPNEGNFVILNKKGNRIYVSSLMSNSQLVYALSLGADEYKKNNSSLTPFDP